MVYRITGRLTSTYLVLVEVVAHHGKAAGAQHVLIHQLLAGSHVGAELHSKA